jgi:LPS-assembly lipoprotein
MWWRKQRAESREAWRRKWRRDWRRLGALAVVLGAASLTAGCFEPLYGNRPTAGGADSVHDKLAEVEIAPIAARQGTPESRLAVGMHNALQFDFNGGAGANAPTHRLLVLVSPSRLSVIVDVASGRPTAEVDGVVANYQLVEIATGKIVLKDTTFAHVDTDAPGSEQRFAQQRARRDAEDRAIQSAAETIRNRLASYFVAGT